jgi:hypothetical protein
MEFSKMRLVCSTTLVVCFLFFAGAGLPGGKVIAGANPHAYFEALIARSDFQTGWSLRPKADVSDPTSPYFKNQLLGSASGGLGATNCPSTIIYDPAHDADPHAQDAAKSPLPSFQEPGICKGHPLMRVLDASTNGANGTVYLSTVTSTYGPPGQRQVQIDDEIMEIRPCTTAEGGDNSKGYITATGVLCVKRGMYGTAAVRHNIGVKPKISTNQINNYLRPAIGTADGNSYVITWDAYWTDSYLGVGAWDQGQKTFQFTNQSEQKLFEPKLLFTGGGVPGFNPKEDIGIVNARSYNEVNSGQLTWLLTNGNVMGKGLTDNTTLAPMVGNFIVKPNTWTRWWVRIDQRANDWDYFDMWVADENTDPVLVYSHVPMSVGKTTDSTKQSVGRFWFEQGDSSTAWLRGNTRDLVAYFRNWVVLRNPADVPALLLRPLAGVPPTPKALAPAKNVRIIGG